MGVAQRNEHFALHCLQDYGRRPYDIICYVVPLCSVKSAVGSVAIGQHLELIQTG